LFVWVVGGFLGGGGWGVCWVWGGGFCFLVGGGGNVHAKQDVSRRKEKKASAQLGEKNTQATGIKNKKTDDLVREWEISE